VRVLEEKIGACFLRTSADEPEGLHHKWCSESVGETEVKASHVVALKIGFVEAVDATASDAEAEAANRWFGVGSNDRSRLLTSRN